MSNRCTKKKQEYRSDVRKSEPSVKKIQMGDITDVEVANNKSASAEEVREVPELVETKKDDDTSPVTEKLSDNSNEVVSVTARVNYGIHTPCTLGGQRIIAFVDCGASVSFVATQLVDRMK